MGGFTCPEINILKKGHLKKHTPGSTEVVDLMKKALVFSMAQTCAGQLSHRSSRALAQKARGKFGRTTVRSHAIFSAIGS